MQSLGHMDMRRDTEMDIGVQGLGFRGVRGS